MKVNVKQEPIYNVEFSEKELRLLYKALGNSSISSWLSLGLNETEATIISDFYNPIDAVLPATVYD